MPATGHNQTFTCLYASIGAEFQLSRKRVFNTHRVPSNWPFRTWLRGLGANCELD